ncbi:hypothetical protein BJ742DRAFT_741749 [Cladochytrium replicatum]|nr:hypothetical protein BJ742DRAFT_741749 [Cladochytrium replicatum]
MIVRNLVEDLADGEILAELLKQLRPQAIPKLIEGTTEKAKLVNLEHIKYERTGDATKTIATKVTSDEPESTDKLSEVTGEPYRIVLGPDEFDEVYGSDEKRPELIKKLLTFASAELSWMHDGAPDLDVARKCSDFDDGVNFILLVGTLGSFFVPMNQYNYRPNNDTHKASIGITSLHNVQFAISLLRDLGADTSRIRAEGKISVS